MYRYAFMLLAGLSILAACAKAGEKGAAPKTFFDLSAYMQQEMQRLDRQQPNATKRIRLNGNSEERHNASINYEQELEVFSRSDINRSSWLDKYTVDSIFQEGQLAQINYLAAAEKLKTRRLEVHFAPDGPVEAIVIHNHTKSMAAELEQKLEYRPAQGYHLENRQSTLLGRDKALEVEVKFAPEQ
jgi:hypothetical protein